MKTLLKNGYIYDGKGGSPIKGNVFIVGDRIISVGKDLPDLSDWSDVNIIDVGGKAIAPGFIDIHRHNDKGALDLAAGIKVRPYDIPILRQGITTVVTGNCGISMYPQSSDKSVAAEARNYYAPVLGDTTNYKDITGYKKYIDAIQGVDLAVNTMSLIGVGAIRIAVNGFSDESLTKEQIVQCQDMVEDALKHGAPGATIGLMYLPECYSSAAELGEILKPLGKHDRILCTHIRGEGDSLVKSVQEVIEIAKIAGCSLEISHFKSCGLKNWHKEIFTAIECIKKARSEGQHVFCDFYPYDCGSTTLMSLIPPSFIGGNVNAALKKLKTEEGIEELRNSLKEEYDDWDNYVISLGWDKAEVSAVNHAENQWMIGKTIDVIARDGNYADGTEAAAKLLLSENGNVAIVIHSMAKEDVDAVAQLPYSIVISDAIYAESDRPHPRMYGAFPHIIRDFVIERNILSLSSAIQKMTSIPADRMGIRDRGIIESGYYADIIVFDPEEFCDNATYTDPTRLATGLSLSMINGIIVVEDDQVIVRNAGRFVRFDF